MCFSISLILKLERSKHTEYSATTVQFTAHCASDTNKCAVIAAETCRIQHVAVSFSFELLVLVKVEVKLSP